MSGLSEDWLAIDESLSENLSASTPDEESEETPPLSDKGSVSVTSVSSSKSSSQTGNKTSTSYRLVQS